MKNDCYATAYALISYQMAYLKANYPQEFMMALIFSNAHTYKEWEAGDETKMKSPERAVKIINECGNLNCKP
jgi:DNA polymerase III alpha subunit